MEIKLKSLTIVDFANIEDKTFNFNLKNSTVFGDNGTGKTTTANSFTWLLFGKNTEGKMIKNIVPINEQGEEQVEKVPTVTAELEVDGEALKLERRSNPVKKKDEYGMTEFTSSRETAFFVNDIPYKKKDYEAYIKQVIDENIFKLITNPNEFPRLHWKDKRELLFSISGTIENQDIIKSDNELESLSEFEDIKAIEDEKKRVHQLIGEGKESLKNIPIQINTLNNQIKDIPTSDVIDDIKKLEAEIEELRDKKYKLVNGSAPSESERELERKKFELENLIRKSEMESESKFSGLESEIKMIDSDISHFESRLKDGQLSIEKLTEQISEARELWKVTKQKFNDESEKELELSDSDICNCCGQKLPVDKIEEHNESARSRFNKEKSERLEELQSKLNRLAKDGKLLSESLKTGKEIVEKCESQINQLSRDKKIKEEYIERLKNEPQSDDNSEMINTIKEEIKQLEAAQNDDTVDNSEEVKAIDEDIKEKSDKKSELINIEAQQDMRKNIEDNIKELKESEATARRNIEELQYQKYLLDKFTVARVNLITNKVNDMFDVARFKMFKEKVDGELEETCLITVDGIAYDEGLNNAMRINVGLDIIETISKYYNSFAPIFIDNAESVTDVYDTTSQQIRLAVKEDEAELRLTQQ